MVGVLDAAQARFHHGEPGLHEHNQEAADECPGEVNAELVLANMIGHITRSESHLWIRWSDVINGAGDRAAWVSSFELIGCGRFGCRIFQFSSRRRRSSRGRRCDWGGSLAMRDGANTDAESDKAENQTTASDQVHLLSSWKLFVASGYAFQIAFLLKAV